eukprot:CAMPEP_0197233160 /NCGR_PEP_ID=MMETSP1429-20130617/1309_1 /TAXON_ID=49237 /ORGANISM="Chaetoceros  sp., Strain UNC1202" /LENGTH=93 /DNA_ID=CAMNT_0042691369 /DNA_START=202 /DNA_END=480 /DNA_ORIENTATION=+
MLYYTYYKTIETLHHVIYASQPSHPRSYNRWNYGCTHQAPKSSQLNVKEEEDALSDVSGLTTPTVIAPQLKHGRGRGGKGSMDENDDDLEGAW